MLAVTSVYLIYPKGDLPKTWSFAPRSFEHKSRPIFRIRSVATTNEDYFKKCSPTVTCDADDKYRTINGSCNNLQNPNLGSAFTPYYRLMNAEFGDGRKRNVYTFRNKIYNIYYLPIIYISYH